MDKSVEILLNSQKDINSVNVDTYQKIELNNRISKLSEYEINNILSVTEVFDAEREGNESYRIYGKIEWLSLLNGLANTYTKLEDFFQPVLINRKDAINSFSYYLVKPLVSSKISSYQNRYIRYFEVIATPSDFDIFPVGFSNNVYGEQAYAFNFNKDFDVSTYLDSFGMPLTELYLYAKYNTKANGNNRTESLQYTTWSTNTGIASKSILSNSIINAGDVIYSDLIEYDKNNFLQTQISPQVYYITTPYSSASRLIWKYEPLIPLKLRYFSNDLYKANVGDTSYDQIQSIPYYATNIDTNGNYVWREILPQGYIDPLTNIGVDYPFVNQKRYLFSNIIIDVIPDLTDSATKSIFNEIWFTQNSTIKNITPIGNLDNIGSPCS